MIRRVGQGRFVVLNRAGTKRLSKPLSKRAAVRRLRQIEYFKRAGR